MNHGLALLPTEFFCMHSLNALHITFPYQVPLYTSALAFLSVAFAQNCQGSRVSYDYLRKKTPQLVGFHKACMDF